MSKNFEWEMKKEYDQIFYVNATEQEKNEYNKKQMYFCQIANDIEERVIYPYCKLLENEITIGNKGLQTGLLKSGFWGILTAVGLISGIWCRANVSEVSNLLLGLAGGSAVGMGFSIADTAISKHSALQEEKSMKDILQEWDSLKKYPKFVQEFMKANGIKEGPYKENYQIPEIELPEQGIKKITMPSSLWCGENE